MIKYIKKEEHRLILCSRFMASVHIQTQRLSVHETRKAETPTALQHQPVWQANHKHAVAFRITSAGSQRGDENHMLFFF